MAEINELREKMANIATEARSKLSEVTDTTPEARAAEIEREFDAMMADHDKLGQKVERLQKVEAALRAGESIDLSRRPMADAGSARAVDEGFKMDYRSAFAEMIANGGEGYVDQEVRNVLKEYRVQTGGTNSAGGFTVPTELATFIEKHDCTGPMYGTSFHCHQHRCSTVNIPPLTTPLSLPKHTPKAHSQRMTLVRT